MQKTLTVKIGYFRGEKQDQIITISNIAYNSIMKVLNEVTQYQLANAEILVICSGTEYEYDDFIIRFYADEFCFLSANWN